MVRTLTVNETPASIEVDPCSLFSPSGIEITPGATYRFEASGKWKDSWIICGPDGWHGFLLERWNRLPGQRFFLLCGVVGKDLTHAFPIGSFGGWSAPLESENWPDRQIYFFANDWPSKYNNNVALSPTQGGPLHVLIKRLS